MIQYILIILGAFIGILLILQVIFFELTKKKLDKELGISWYSQLNKPYSYHRAKRMLSLGAIAYIISNFGEPINISYFLYMILFIAMSIVADATVLYLVHLYSKIRCKNEIAESLLLKKQLEKLTDSLTYDDRYEISDLTFNEKQIYKHYIQTDDHIAFISEDEGLFVSQFECDAHIIYDVEPQGNQDDIQNKMTKDNIKVLSLASEQRLPFKEEKIDTLICRYAYYKDEEVNRVLKSNGYFIIKQYGAQHLKEMTQLYTPYGIKILWDASYCGNTLEKQGMKVVESHDSFGTIKFYTIQAVYSYFLDTSKEFCDTKKYEQLYLNALSHIAKNGYYEMTTHEFIVVARK